MDIFDTKNIKPMLIAEEQKPFNDINYIYELKLDGIRCIAYLDESGTELHNKRNLKITNRYPELNNIHKQINKRCILDGELIVFAEGRPDFSEIQRRSLMTNKVRIELSAKKYPVTFVAYDILYYDNKQITDLPLMDRKKLLEENINENDRISISRYIEENGIVLYELTVQQDLEGIVAKKKDSRYYFGKNTRDWIKIKNLKDDDFVVCGYIEKSEGTVSIVLGQYDKNNMLVYKGHVTMGINKSDFQTIINTRRIDVPEFGIPKGNDKAIWLEPINVCAVRFMEKTSAGSLRQPVFKGLRVDKTPRECIDDVSL